MHFKARQVLPASKLGFIQQLSRQQDEDMVFLRSARPIVVHFSCQTATHNGLPWKAVWHLVVLSQNTQTFLVGITPIGISFCNQLSNSCS